MTSQATNSTSFVFFLKQSLQALSYKVTICVGKLSAVTSLAICNSEITQISGREVRPLTQGQEADSKFSLGSILKPPYRGQRPASSVGCMDIAICLFQQKTGKQRRPQKKTTMTSGTGNRMWQGPPWNLLQVQEGCFGCSSQHRAYKKKKKKGTV